MDQETVVEKLKKKENDINLKAQIRGFMVEITDNKNNTGTITIWHFNKDAKKLNELLTFIEILDIEGISSCQINMKKNNEILEYGLFMDNIAQWLYNRLHNDSIEFRYEFVGGKYNGQIMTKKEIESISHGTTKDLTLTRQQGGICHRKELDNQPLVKDYLSPMFSHIDYGIIYLRYETQEVYDISSN